MPNIYGGSSTDREYAPHMYMMGAEGYEYVGNSARRTFTRNDQGFEIQIGSSILDEVIVNKIVPDEFLHRNVQVRAELGDITPEVARILLEGSLNDVCFTTASVVAALALRLEPPIKLTSSDIDILKDEPNVADIFSGNQEQIDTYTADRNRKKETVASLRKNLGIELGEIDDDKA